MSNTIEATAVRQRNSVRANIVANFLGNGWSLLMGLAFVPIYISFIGIEAYGLIGLLATLQVWFSILDMGLTATLSREMATFEENRHSSQSVKNLLVSIESIYIAVAAAVIAIAYSGANWIASHWLKLDTVSVATAAQSLTACGLIIALRFFAALYRGALTGLQTQVWLNAVVALFATLRFGGVVLVLAYISPTVEAFLTFQAIVSLLEALALRILVQWVLPGRELRGKFDLSVLSNIVKFASGVTLISILAVALTQVDKLMLSTLLPLAQFAHYALASLAAGALGVLISPIANAVAPKLAQLAADRETTRFCDAYHRYSQLMAILACPIALSCIAFMFPLIRIWTKDAAATAEIAPIAQLLFFGTMLNAIATVPYLAQLAVRWTRLTALTNLAALTVSIPILLVFVPIFGPTAAAFVWIAVNGAYIAFAVPAMHRHILVGSGQRWFLHSAIVPVAIAGLTALSCRYVAERQFDETSPFQLLALVLSIGVGCMTAAIALPSSRSALLILHQSGYRRGSDGDVKKAE